MTEPIAELDARFSEPDAVPPSWAEVEAVLAAAEMFTLATVRSDGRPHVTPIPAVWFDGALHICTGAHEQKAVNLFARPQCVLSISNGALKGGMDVVVEGAVEPVVDHDRLVALAAEWKRTLDWDFEVVDGGFADGANRDGRVFRLVATKVLAFGKGPYTQTRFRFPA